MSKTCQGFTIAEVLLAGFVLSVGMVTVMSLFSASHRQSFDTRNVIIATELAQEGAEIVRNIRDNNIAYRTAHWGTTAPNNCSETNMSGDCDPFRYFPNGANQRCTVSYNSSVTADMSCPGSPSTLLSLDGNGLYQHGGGTATRFHRLLKIDHTGGADTARVQSFVTWQDPGSNLNGSNTAVPWCTLANQCVYTELLLDNWK
ncbi:MAG: hypothetical protein WBO92_02635 [Candidatus Moraniibacteriota bacterium]